jgi:hypothetical protein
VEGKAILDQVLKSSNTAAKNMKVINLQISGKKKNHDHIAFKILESLIVYE